MNWATDATFMRLPTSRNQILPQASQQLFEGKTLPQAAGGRKCFPKVFRIPKHGFLCYKKKKTNLFLISKNVLIVMVSILIDKDIVEPSYNDLKITV